MLLRTFKTAVCPASNPPNASAGLTATTCPCHLFSGDSRLPFARPQTPQTLPALPQASKATTLTATCPCHLFFRGFKTAVCPPSKPPNASNVCPPSNSPKCFRRPPRQQLFLQLLHALAICFSGGSRLPFARPQTPQTLPTPPQASKATTLTATCPCHLFFRGFKTAVCPPSCPRTFKTAVCPASNPPNASAGLQGNSSYSYYMPLPSVFQGVQDCRLPALKPPKPFQRSRRPPRQQLLQLHAPAICFSGGSRLPFARPQTPQTLPTLPQASASNPPNASAGFQGNNSYLIAATIRAPASVFQGVQDCRLAALKPTLPQASKATTLTATCPCHLFFRGFKTAVCPPSNTPNASNAPAGLQGNNSYSYMSSNPPNASNPLAGLQGPAICFSGGSRLPFAWPQTPQTLPTLPQASKATILTATCPCHLFFRGFKTAVCLPSNHPNASNPPAGLQGNNSYSCMPLPSVFQGVQDCRLPGLKPSKRFRMPPRQQLLQLLHAPAICFSGGSRLPFARPQTNAPAGLQGNNSYSYMPLPSVFQGVQDCRLPALKHPKRFQRSRRPPRQQLLQLHVLKPSKRFQPSRRPPRPCHLFFRGFKTAVCLASNPPNASNPPSGLQGNNSYSYMPLPSVFQGVQDCRLPALKPPKRFQPSRRPPRQQLLQLHAPAICFSGGSRLPFARPQTLQTLPHASKATTLTAATCPCHLFFRGFKTAVCPPSNPPNPSNAPAGLQGNNSYSYTCPCHLFFRGFKTAFCPPSNPPNASDAPAGHRLKPSKRFRRPPRQQLLLQLLHAPAICFSRGSRLPFARPQTPQTLPTLPQASKATTLTATCPCHLFFRGFKTAVCPPSNPPNPSNAPAGLQGNNSYSYMSSNPPNASNPLAGLQGPAICFSGGSRLPFARPQTPQTLPTLPQASKATTLTATTCPCHLFFRGFKTAVCSPSNPRNASNAPAGLRLKPSKRFRRPPRQQLLSYCSYYTCPCHLFFRGFKTAVCPPSNPPNPSNAPAGLQGNNSYSYMPCRLFFRRFKTAVCSPSNPPNASNAPAGPPPNPSGSSRLPFARPQTSQTLPTLPQASKATTLTATCPCHLFFRGFKTAVCPPANPLNASNPPAGLQGNNSYSYMPLPSVFHGVQDCRLPGLKPPPQTLPTLPQASKATTLTATCPCHLFFRGFKTAICPASNPPNASNPSAGLQAGLQGNNSYSYMPKARQMADICSRDLPWPHGWDLDQNRFPMIPEEKFNSRPMGR